DPQFGMGKSKTRMFAWSTMTAKFVNSSMATPNVGEPGIPKVCCVLKGFEMLSTIEIVLLAELEVRIAPVWGLMAREVGLMPTLTELPPPVSGLNCTMVLDRKSTRLNSSHVAISYAVFCLKKKKQHT